MDGVGTYLCRPILSSGVYGVLRVARKGEERETKRGDITSTGNGPPSGEGSVTHVDPELVLYTALYGCGYVLHICICCTGQVYVTGWHDMN